SAFVLAPHADDETIGCGATIARKVSCGTAVHVVIATDSDDARRAECGEACRRLGLPSDALHFLGLPDGGLAAHQQDLDGALRSAVGSFRPDEVMAPFATDAHPDHRALAASAERLCAEALPDATLLSYPVWFWNRWAWVDRSMPRRAQDVELVWRPLAATFSLRARVVRTGGFLAHKRNALVAHASHTLDADCVPTPDALAAQLAITTRAPVVLARMVDRDSGEIVDTHGWCGVLLAREVVETVGIPDPALFWWNEDTEYLQWRIPRAGFR